MENSKETKVDNIHDGCQMFVLAENTTSERYGLFIDKVVAIKKQGQIIILGPKDLRKLEEILGCDFKL